MVRFFLRCGLLDLHHASPERTDTGTGMGFICCGCSVQITSVLFLGHLTEPKSSTEKRIVRKIHLLKTLIMVLIDVEVPSLKLNKQMQSMVTRFRINNLEMKIMLLRRN